MTLNLACQCDPSYLECSTSSADPSDGLAEENGHDRDGPLYRLGRDEERHQLTGLELTAGHEVAAAVYHTQYET